MYLLITFLIFIRVTTANNLTLYCNGATTHIKDDCSIECSKSVDTYIVKISCTSSDSWDDFYKFKFEDDTSNVNGTQLTFLNSVFPRNFNLYNFSNSLGLKNIDRLKLIQPKFESPLLFFLLFMNITQLEIEGANFKTIPDTFLELPTLDTLKIIFGDLEVLKSQDFGILNNLRHLDLSNNQISAIETDTFKNLSNLISINLKNNKLSELPTELFKGTSLKILDLSSNQLTNFSS